jgi:hypothetical protein
MSPILPFIVRPRKELDIIPHLNQPQQRLFPRTQTPHHLGEQLNKLTKFNPLLFPKRIPIQHQQNTSTSNQNEIRTTSPLLQPKIPHRFNKIPNKTFQLLQSNLQLISRPHTTQLLKKRTRPHGSTTHPFQTRTLPPPSIVSHSPTSTSLSPSSFSTTFSKAFSACLKIAEMQRIKGLVRVAGRML